MEVFTENWALIAPVIVAVSSLLMAVLPQGQSGSFWDIVRTVLNKFALNVGSAKNAVK